MRFDKLKLFTASTLILLGSQSGNIWAEDNTASQDKGQATSTAEATSSAEAPATAQTQADTAQAPQTAYRGYRYRRYNHGYNRPFGNRGPGFRGPWNRKGSGFGFSNSDGPGWGSDPGFGPWGDRDREFYDRGPGFRGPWHRGRGSGFGISSDDGPDWDSGPGYRRGPGFGPWGDSNRGFYDRGPGFRGPWDRGNGSGMGFGWEPPEKKKALRCRAFFGTKID